MKSEILVDTSIWIEYFNHSDSAHGESLERLLLEKRVVCSGIVLAELLQGAKIEQEFNDILENMIVLPFLETRLETWISAGQTSYSLRREGITVPITDMVMASLCFENNCSIFSLDRHFDLIPDLRRFDMP